MGEEKAPKGGDGGKDAEPPQPVVLRMELHCAGCAQKVKKSIKHLPGVESVVADAAANRIVVAGTADAAALKARIEAKTKKAVEIVSAGSGGPKKAAAESKADKDGGGGGEKKKGDKDGVGEKKGDKYSQPKEEEEEEEKQPPEEKKPKEETVLLKIRLHCDSCADRIRRRIYKIKGVKDVVLDSNAKDEVKITGTMDVAAMLVYLKEKLNRTVEAVASDKKDGGDDKKNGDKKDKGGEGDKKKDAAAAGGDDKKGKGKGVEEAGPFTVAAAAASMAPPPAEASTYHVSPYGYVAYQQGPPASYYHYYGSNADGAVHADPNDATYYPHHPNANANPNYPPYPYRFDMAPAPQLFSDENPNACSLM